MNAPATVRRHIQIQVCSSPHTVEIQFQEILRRPYTGILVIMPEPARTNGNVHFRGNPVLPVHRTFHAQLVADRAGGRFRSRLQRYGCIGSPAGITRITALIPHPPDIRPHIGKNDGFRLEFFQFAPCRFPLVIGASVNRSLFPRPPVITVATVRSVKPGEEKGAVACRQLLQLPAVHSDIFRRTVGGRVAVPGRQVHPELETVFFARAGDVFHDISLPVLPRGGSHAVPGSLRGPQTKPVVMLAGQHHSFEPGIRQCLDKIVRIKIGRIEKFRLFVPISPFLSRKRIDCKMDKGIHLHVMPGQLPHSGSGKQRCNLFLRTGGSHAARKHTHSQQRRDQTV